MNDDPRPTSVAEQRVYGDFLARLTALLGTPSKLKLPSHLALSALAHLTGQLARLTLRQPEDVHDLVRDGWEAVPQDAVDRFQAAAKRGT